METNERDKRIQRFLIENKKYFPQGRMNDIKGKLQSLTDEQFEQVEWLEFKDPLTMSLIAIFLGTLGVDRFMLGDSKNGIFKLLLCCLLVGVIWWFVDLFSITERTTLYNFKTLNDTITYL